MWRYTGRVDGDGFIGRGAELEHMRRCLQSATTAHGTCVVLVGEPGVGKSRLAHELLEHARHSGFGTLIGRCFEQHAGQPFFPFAELLAQAWELAVPSVREEGAERWAELGRVIPEMVQSPQDNSADAQPRIRRAVTQFLRACAVERPLVVFVDDLQWADSASLDLILDLGRHLRDAPILLLGTYRDVELGPDHALEATLHELLRERVLDEIDVQPLPCEGTAALITARLGSPFLSSDFVELLHARTEGNPLFIEEMLKALVEDGSLIQTRDGWQCKSASKLHVPRSLRSVIGHRLSRFTPGAREFLALASVLGQQFDLELVLAAGDQPEANVLDNVDAALQARLIAEQRGERMETYSFTHALIRQTIFDELPVHRRRRLHQRVGEALERLRAGRAQTWAELAQHFVASGDGARAVRYAVQAADRAAELHAHSEAAEYYRVALDFVMDQGDGRDAARLQRRLGNELHELNQRSQALASFEAALMSYRQIGDRVGQAEMHREIGWVHQARSEFAAATPHLEAAIRLWPSTGDDADFARLLLDTARIKLYAGAMNESFDLGTRGLAVAERGEDGGLLARALVEYAFVKSVMGARADEVIVLLDRAEGLAVTADPKLLNRLYFNRGSARWRSGELVVGVADCRRGVAAAEKVEQPGAAAWFSHFVASMESQKGDWPSARTTLQRAGALDAQVSEYAHVLPWMDGDYALALELMRHAVDEARARGDGRTVAERLTDLCDAFLQLERLEEAEACARETVSLVVSSSWESLELVIPHATAAEVLVRSGAPDAEALLVDAEQRAELHDHGLARPALLRTRALIALRRGELSAALSVLEASAAEARKQGALVQLGRTLAVLSGVAATKGHAHVQQTVDAERTTVVERIGPHVEHLPWTASITTASTQKSLQKPAPPGPLAVLTPREQQVAALVARGLTDREIAEALIITEGTAGSHVGHILNKLGFRSRAQVAAWAAEHHLINVGDTSR